jgi:hypothetical protein
MAFLLGDFFDAEIAEERRCAEKTRRVAFAYMCRFFDAEIAEERRFAKNARRVAFVYLCRFFDAEIAEEQRTAKKIRRVAFAALCSFAHFASIFYMRSSHIIYFKANFFQSHRLIRIKL